MNAERSASEEPQIRIDETTVPDQRLEPRQNLSSSPPTQVLGTRIGPYELLEQIGEGGMGAVFMAQQEVPVRRMVALKLIRVGMDTAQLIARFETERQALALMDHLSIARVLDAGTVCVQPNRRDCQPSAPRI